MGAVDVGGGLLDMMIFFVCPTKDDDVLFSSFGLTRGKRTKNRKRRLEKLTCLSFDSRVLSGGGSRMRRERRIKGKAVGFLFIVFQLSATRSSFL